MSLERVASGDDKLNYGLNQSFGSCVSVEINCKCALMIRLKPVGPFGQVEIVCRFRRDRLSISFGALKPRSCVDFARCSLEFGSDLKNLHWRGEYRERIKIRDRVFKLYDMISIDRAVDQYEQGVGRSTGLSTDVARGT